MDNVKTNSIYIYQRSSNYKIKNNNKRNFSLLQKILKIMTIKITGKL